MPNHYDPTLVDILRVDKGLYFIIWDLYRVLIKPFHTHKRVKIVKMASDSLRPLEYERILVVLRGRNAIKMIDLEVKMSLTFDFSVCSDKWSADL